MLPIFAICSSSRIFSRRAFPSGGSILSGHIKNLLSGVSILHHSGGLHKVWDGLSFALAVDEETDTLLKYDVVDLSHPIDAALLDNIQKDGMMLYEKI